MHRGRKSASYTEHRKKVFRKNSKNRTFQRAYGASVEEFNLAVLAREIRRTGKKTQKELAKVIGTTASAIARLERLDYTGQSLPMLQKIASACKVELTLTARKPSARFMRRIALSR